MLTILSLRVTEVHEVCLNMVVGLAIALWPVSANAQQDPIDSIISIIDNTNSHDTSLCHAYLSWGEEVYLISRGSNLLSRVAKSQGDFKEALAMYEVHIQMRDSINNDETQKAFIRQQTKYEFESPTRKGAGRTGSSQGCS